MNLTNRIKKKLLLTSLFTISTGLLYSDDESKIIDLDSYTVTGYSEEIATNFSDYGKLDVPLLETARSVSIVNHGRFEEIGAINIQDTMNYTVGVVAGPYGLDSRLDSHRIRGTSPLKFQDGFQSLFGFYNNTRSELYTLEQVEVLKGPASVLFGKGALGGVVNSVSKLPSLSAQNEVVVQYGSFDRKQIGADLSGKLDNEGRFLYRLVGVLRESGTQVDHVNDDAKVVMPSLKWNISDATSLTVLANFQENNAGQTLQFLPNEGALTAGPEVPTNTFIGEPGWDRYDTKQKAYSVFFNHQLSESFELSMNARYTDGEADYKSHWVAYDGADPIIAEDGTINRTIYDAPGTSEAFTWNAAIKGDLQTGEIAHKLVFEMDAQDVTTDTDSYYGWAAGGRINIFDPIYGNLATVYPVNDTPAEISEQLGLSIRDSITFNQWHIGLGIRYDKVEAHTSGSESLTIDDSATIGNIGILYAFENGIRPYASWAESFEPLGSTTGMDGSNIQLDPKRGTQHEVGLKYQPEKSNTIFTASYFMLEEYERPLSDGLYVRQENVDTEGFEFELQSSWKQFYIQAGYSKVDARDGSGNKITAIPDSEAVLWVTYKPENERWKGLRVGGGIRHQGKSYDGASDLSTDGNTLLDAVLSYQFDRLLLRLNVNNLADKTYVASTNGGRSFYGSRRNISLSAKYSF